MEPKPICCNPRMVDGQRNRRLLLIVPWQMEELPYSVAYLIRPAREAGYDTEAWYYEPKEGWDRQLARRLREGAYDVVGVSTGSFPVLRRVVQICQIVRCASSASVLVLGGPAITAQPTFVMDKTGADVGFLGEADLTWPLFLRALVESSAVADVPGLIVRTRDGGLHTTGPAPTVQDLATIEPPPWEFFPLHELFHASSPLLAGRATHVILAARGCPYSCNFCFHTSRFRCRPVDDVIAEIRYFHETHGIDSFRFVDATATANVARFKELCRAIAALPFRIQYCVGTQVSCVDAELLSLLAASGCALIVYGVESGDDRVLRSIAKHTTVARISQTLDLTEQAGIPCLLTVMFGQLDETVQSMQRTLVLILSRRASVWRLVCQPLPGTRLYDIAKARRLLRDDEDFYARFASFDRPSVNLTKLSDRELDDALARVAFVFACLVPLQGWLADRPRAVAALVPVLWRAAPGLSAPLRWLGRVGQQLRAVASTAR